jgi:hypothetical protein
MAYWLGRLWSLCLATPLLGLICRVIQISFRSFSKVSEQIPQPHHDLDTSKCKKKFTWEKEADGQKHQRTPDEIYNLSPIFGEEEEGVEQTAEKIPPKSEELADVQIDHKEEEHSDPAIENGDRDKIKDEITVESTPAPLSPDHPLMETNALPSDKTEPLTTNSKFKNFKRHPETDQTGKKGQNNPLVAPKGTPKATSVGAQKTESEAKPANKPAYKLIECGSDGNCQLYTILKGIQVQHPELMQYEEGDTKVTLNADKLRQIGVDFAREQIKNQGIYVEFVLGYLDADRLEYNDCIDPKNQREMRTETTQLEEAYKNKKVTQDQYNNESRAIKTKYSETIASLDKRSIKTHEELLQRLEDKKKKFWCSTTHLYALSIKLQVPIYVKDQLGVMDHDIQKFNPTDSSKDPIYLYRVNRNHYKYMDFSNRTK